ACAKRIKEAPRDLDNINNVFNQSLYEDIVEIFNVEAVRSILSGRYSNNLRVPDGGVLLMDRLGHLDPYEAASRANKLDFLLASYPTVGIHVPLSTQLKYAVADCSGWRCEREKWKVLACQNLKMIFFVVSLGDFDLVSRENGQNRFVDSVNFFGELSANPLLQSIPILLIFNKIDVFREKLNYKKFSDYVVEYKGRNDYHYITNYIKMKFLKGENTINHIFASTLDSGDVQAITSIAEAYFKNQPS
ncbi:G-protein subunit alpha, partial [Acrasis kona]